MTFEVDIKDALIGYTGRFCSAVNLGRRGKNDGNVKQQFIGALAQNCFLDALNQPLMTPEENGTYDGGIDGTVFDFTLDVKGTEFKDGYSNDEHLLFAGQFQPGHELADVYLFFGITRGWKYRLKFCGWLPNEMLLGIASRFKAGDEIVFSNGHSFQAKADGIRVEHGTLFNRAGSFAELFGELYMHAQTMKAAA